MIIKGIKKILKSDIPDSPDWFDQVLYIINQFMDTTITALRNRLAIEDNMLAEVKELEFIHGIEQEVTNSLGGYSGFLILKTPDTNDINYAITGWLVRQKKPGILGVTILFNGAGVTAGKVKFSILG